MKLRHGPTSPFVRKVMVVAHETGLEGRIERIATKVWAPDTDVAKDNPLGKIPALILDDGAHACSPGDCVVLSGVDHAWKTGPSGCRMSTVAVGTPPADLA